MAGTPVNGQNAILADHNQVKDKRRKSVPPLAVLCQPQFSGSQLIGIVIVSVSGWTVRSYLKLYSLGRKDNPQQQKSQVSWHGSGLEHSGHLSRCESRAFYDNQM